MGNWPPERPWLTYSLEVFRGVAVTLPCPRPHIQKGLQASETPARMEHQDFGEREGTGGQLEQRSQILGSLIRPTNSWNTSWHIQRRVEAVSTRRARRAAPEVAGTILHIQLPPRRLSEVKVVERPKCQGGCFARPITKQFDKSSNKTKPYKTHLVPSKLLNLIYLLRF